MQNPINARRRFLTSLGVLAIAASGAAWSGCGDDDEEEAQEAVQEITDQANDAVDEGLDAAEEGASEVQDAVDEAKEEVGQ